jgi:hypothetical protein
MIIFTKKINYPVDLFTIDSNLNAETVAIID